MNTTDAEKNPKALVPVLLLAPADSSGGKQAEMGFLPRR